MVKQFKKVVALVAIVALTSSCSLTLPVAATSNTVGQKVGTAKANGFFGILYFNADASIQSAAKSAGITKISTVDIKRTNVLGIITNFETIVTGE